MGGGQRWEACGQAVAGMTASTFVPAVGWGREGSVTCLSRKGHRRGEGGHRMEQASGGVHHGITLALRFALGFDEG